MEIVGRGQTEEGLIFGTFFKNHITTILYNNMNIILQF